MGIRSRRAGAAFAIAAVVLLAAAAGAFDAPDRALFDAAMRANRAAAPVPVPDRVVVVGIDEAFLDGVAEPLALSHAYVARFLSIMAAHRPAAVGLDVVLPEKRFDTLAPVAAPDTDYHSLLVGGLLQATQRVPVVVAKAWDVDRGHYRDLQLDYAAVLATQSGAFSPQGSALFCLDPDDVLRDYPGRDCQPDRSDRTFASELVTAATGRRPIGGGRIDYRVGGEFLYVPLQEVFRLDAAGDTRRLEQLFEGRIMMLGAILDDTDLVRLPVPMAEWRPGDVRVPGVLAHAQLVRDLLHDGFVRTPGLPGRIALLIAVLAPLTIGRARVALATAAMLSIALAAGTVFGLRAGWWLEPSSPAVAIIAMLAWRLGVDARTRRRRRVAVREAFAGHVDAATLATLVDGTAPPPAARRVHVAVVECEIAVATGRDVAADALARRTTDALELAAAAVHRHAGTVDVVAGTRLTAFFGA
ncbi:CHASE2 domain-containing protein, partial [Lysobacter xanthus]